MSKKTNIFISTLLIGLFFYGGYASARGGNLTVLMEESNENNNYLITQITVRAINIPSITVTSPNEGEKFTRGNSHNISWESKNAPSNSWVWIGYMREYAGKTYYELNEHSSKTSGSYTWQLVDNLMTGEVSFGVILYSGSLGDKSNELARSFNNLEIVEKNIPYTLITILSPNGGERYFHSSTDNGDLIETNVRVENATKNGTLSTYLVHSTNDTEISSNSIHLSTGYAISPSTVAISYRTDVTFANNFDAGSYYIMATWNDELGNLIRDYSNAPFNIIATSPTPTPIPIPTPTIPIQTNLPDNTLIKLPNDPKIYVIKDGKKKWIKTADEFNQEGYDWSDVEETSLEVVNAYADYLVVASNLIRAANQTKVYKIISNKRLWIPTAEAFIAMGNNWSDIEDVNETEVNQYARLKLVKLANDPKVYYLTEKGLKRHIPTIEVFNSYNYDWSDIVEVSSDVINSYENNSLIMMQGDYKVYSLSNGIRRWIKTDEAFNRLNYDKSKIEQVNRSELFSYDEEGHIE